MGYNTAAMFLNDAIDGLKRDPDIGHKIYEAIIMADRPGNRERGYTDFSISNHCNGGMVIPSRHADEVQIVAVGGNYMKRLGYSYWTRMDDPVEMCKALADQLGYRLVKKAER
jgi:hypothetical protein